MTPLELLALEATTPGEFSPPAPRRPAIRYYGGKWRMAPWIIKHFPPHTCYVEPFAGAASVLLRKAPSVAEVMNDLDHEVVDFFRVLRSCPGELIRAIELTPFARQEWELAAERDWSDPVEAARRVYVRAWQGHHGGMRPNRTGWRRHRGTGRLTTAAHEFADVEHLEQIVARLRTVQIECAPAVEVMCSFDSPATLHYVDPPYPKSTRSHQRGADGYRYEMDDAQHAELLKTLLSLSGMVVVSGYACELYDSALVGWPRLDRDHRTQRANSIESLWLSPNAAAQLWPLGRIA